MEKPPSAVGSTAVPRLGKPAMSGQVLGPGWFCGGWGTAGVRGCCASPLCCCSCPVSPQRGHLLGGFTWEPCSWPVPWRAWHGDMQSRAPSFSPPRGTLPQEKQGTSCKGPAHRGSTAGQNKWLVCVAHSLAVAMLSLLRWLSTAISTLKVVIALERRRLLRTLFLMSLAVLAGACCSALMEMGRQQTEDLQQVLLEQLVREQAADEVEAKVWRSVFNSWREQSQELQRLRAEVARLAADMDALKKGLQSTTGGYPPALHGSARRFYTCVLLPSWIPFCRLRINPEAFPGAKGVSGMR